MFDPRQEAPIASPVPATSPSPSPAPVPSPPSPAASSLNSSEKESKEEKKGLQQNDSDQCSICMAAPTDTALIECGHLFCEKCALPFVGKECAICRQKVVRTLKIFKV
jgi:hypothetical protein